MGDILKIIAVVIITVMVMQAFPSCGAATKVQCTRVPGAMPSGDFTCELR